MEKTEKKIQPVVRICWNCRNKVGQDYEICPKCGRLPIRFDTIPEEREVNIAGSGCRY